MIKNIQKVVVHYEDGQTEEFVGKGMLRRVNSTVDVETDGRVLPVPVSYITIGMPVDAQAE